MAQREAYTPGSQERGRLTPAERRRSTVARLREAHQVSDEAIAQYLDFLNDPRNRMHFVDPPTTVEGVRKYVSTPEHPVPEHLLLAVNTGDEVLGGAIIEDARPRQHDHFVTNFVVDPDRQHRGIGLETMRRVLDWSATTPTYDERHRRKIDLAIIEVEGWRKMRDLVERLGFRRVSYLRDQVDVDGPDGITTDSRPTRRYELMLDNWRAIRGLRAVPAELRR
ncbi:MAG: GNAT family N-acetyltransferase [Candidatus Taylorbacteria bacterium]|nr:GNAT family N-acetyltransferase [Candidatus Taylorbacteria bacterium]